MINIGTRKDEWLEKCAKLKKRQEFNLQSSGRICRLHQTCPGFVHVYVLLNLSPPHQSFLVPRVFNRSQLGNFLGRQHPLAGLH